MLWVGTATIWVSPTYNLEHFLQFQAGVNLPRNGIENFQSLHALTEFDRVGGNLAGVHRTREVRKSPVAANTRLGSHAAIHGVT